MKGAEAIITKSSLLGRPVVIKSRIEKNYRISPIDSKLRRERTKAEARLLNKAKVAGVHCPTVLEVDEFSLTLDFIDGKRPDMSISDCKQAGSALAKLHLADIIHGDFTPANLILHSQLFIIDFGLGFVSTDIEDKATDVFTMLRVLETKKQKEAFLEGYETYPKYSQVLTRIEGIEKRVRYAI